MTDVAENHANDFSDRFVGPDFLRALAMLFGLIFHAPLLYYIPSLANELSEFGISQSTIPELEDWLCFLLQ